MRAGGTEKTRSKLAQELPELTLDLNAKPTEVRLLFAPGHDKQCISGKDVCSEAIKMFFASVKSWLPTLVSCLQVPFKHPFVPQYCDVVTRASYVRKIRLHFHRHIPQFPRCLHLQSQHLDTARLTGVTNLSCGRQRKVARVERLHFEQSS